MAKKSQKKDVNLTEKSIDITNNIENINEVETKPLVEEPNTNDKINEEVEEIKNEENNPIVKKQEEKVVETKNNDNTKIEEKQETIKISATSKRYNPFRYTFVNEWNGQTFED